MTLTMKDLSPKQREEAKEEAKRIKDKVEKQSTGDRLGGTFFGQEADDGMAPPRNISAGKS